MRRHSSFQEPSLVPLADMLTNTVGIMIFILVFVVLVAGGAVAVKRFPVEHGSAGERPSMHFLCSNARVRPFDADGLRDKFLEQIGSPLVLGQARWEHEFLAQQVEDQYLIFGGIQDPEGLWFRFTSKPGTGETEAELEKETSTFRSILREIAGPPQLGQPHLERRPFVYFHVDVDSIDVFLKARDIAASMGVGYGWLPGSDHLIAYQTYRRFRDDDDKSTVPITEM